MSRAIGRKIIRRDEPVTRLRLLLPLLIVVAVGPFLSTGCDLIARQTGTDASRNGGGSGAMAKILAADWVHTTKADFTTGTGENIDITERGDGEIRLAMTAGRYGLAGTYTSVVKESSFPFNAVGVQWKANVPDRAELVGEIRSSADGANYTDWMRVATGADAEDRAGRGTYIAELVLAPFHRWVQYRLLLRTRDATVSPVVEEVVVTFIDSTRGPDLEKAKADVVQPKVAGQPAIIPRSAWGADESLRFKNGQEIWPTERRPIQKFIIHHTVTQNDDPNPPATIRAIYQYHASKLGWGDIGYNYLVDAQGNIYEGRYGGEESTAGHAKQYNFGSLGVTVLGNFNTASLPGPARDALTSLVSWYALRYAIDPNGSSFLVDKEFPNISGHRDALPTSCPGDYLEKELPEIRSRVTAQFPLYGLKWESHDTPSTLQPKQTATVRISVSNRGRKVWKAKGDGLFRLGYHWYRADGTPVRQSPADDRRTGLPSDVAFGQTVSVAALVTAPEDPGTYTLRWDIAYEGAAWLADLGAAPLEVAVRVGKAEQTPQASPTAAADPTPGPTPGLTDTLRSTWYFAEGATSRGYRTYFHVLNPGDELATVVFTFMTEDGKTHKNYFSVQPSSRLTVLANDLVPNANIAAKIESDKTIYVERTMLFGHDGHTSKGAEGPARTWYFAEGATGWGFGTWFLLMNPNETEAKVVVTFFRENGSSVTKEYRLKPTSRLNVFANKEVPGANVATKIEADKPIVAERSMYIDGGKGGHGSLGAEEGSTSWLFAEGYTGPGVSTWLLLFNPNRSAANVTLTLFKDGGEPTVRAYSVAPMSRRNVLVNQVTQNAAVSAKVEADIPIVAERSMYFANGKGAHNTAGSTRAAKTWYLPEGYTGEGVGEWLLVFNPGSTSANLEFTFIRSDGTTSRAGVTVGPLQRYTLYLNSMIPNSELSVKVEASGPVVVERAIYFANGEGGTVSLGIPAD